MIFLCISLNDSFSFGQSQVFGRGGEEMDFLKEKGIQVHIIPGITAASGISAEIGVPLTQRGVANRYLNFTSVELLVFLVFS